MENATKPGFPGYFFGKNIVTRLHAAPGKVTPACPSDEIMLISRALSERNHPALMKNNA